jgi:hypothetical protein
MVLRILIVCALVGGLLAVAGCGGSKSSSETTETVTSGTGTLGEESVEESTPEEALAELEAIGPLLDDALARYEAGEQAAAADAVGDIYLERFEKVEGPLGERNHDLMEELEEKISTELRTAMQEGKSNAEIESLVAEIKSELDEAKAELE